MHAPPQRLKVIKNIFRLFRKESAFYAKNVEAYVVRMEFADRHNLAQKIPIETLSDLVRKIYGHIGGQVAALGGRATALDIGDLMATIPGDINKARASKVLAFALDSRNHARDLLDRYLDKQSSGMHIGLAYGQVVVSDGDGKLAALGVPVLRATGAMKIAEANNAIVRADSLVGNILGWKEYPLDSGIAKSFQLNSVFGNGF